jgi:uncharacterized protein
MPQFAHRLQPTRIAILSSGPNESEASVVGEHFEYLSELTAQGWVLFAGRTLTTDEHTFGIVVLEAESQAEARHVMANNPAVLHRVMRAELCPFRVALWSSRGPQAQPDDA